jgi:hypothetical protein
MWSGRLGQVQSSNHRIDLIPGQNTVHCQPYREGHRARAVESAEIERMIKAEVIEPATSEWASPIFLVAKPDGPTRFCVDYRKLNAITVCDSYPLPRMDECIDSLGDSKTFATLDCNSGYWQIPVRPEDREKTTFTSHCHDPSSTIPVCQPTYANQRMPTARPAYDTFVPADCVRPESAAGVPRSHLLGPTPSPSLSPPLHSGNGTSCK